MNTNSPTKLKRKHSGDLSRLTDLCSNLRDMAVARGPHAKLPTTRELCSTFKTSFSTVNNALQALEEQKVVYRRQGSGIYVSPKIHRKTIMVLLDSTFFSAHGSPFWGMLWALFAKEAAYRASFKDEDFQFHLETPPVSAGPPLSEPVMKDIEAGKVDGILCIGMNRFVIEWIEARGVPTVTYAAPCKWEVQMALEAACRIGVDSLANDGCRAIGLWSPAGVHDVDETREEMALSRFHPAVMQKGLTFDPAFFVGGGAATGGAQPVPTNQEQGYYTALRLFGDPASPKPDGLLIEDDMMTDGAIAGLEKVGVRVGEDVKIAAYTNLGSPILFSHQEKLTRIEFDPGDIPTAMLRLLDEAMAGQDPPPQVAWIEPTERRGSF